MTPNIILPKSSYFGGKSAANIPYILISQIPKHELFISGFLGHCGPLRFIEPATRTAAIEINSDVISDWRLATYSECRSRRIFSDEAGPIAFSAIPPGHLAFYHADSLRTEFPSDPDTFIFLDPPYPHSTRASQKRYDFEMTDDQHRYLLAKFSDSSSMIMICTYDNDIYREALDDWRKIHYTAMTRGGKLALETAYMNYPEPRPTSLHDVRFTGKDFRDRERRKRKLRTISKNIAMLEPSDLALLFTELEKKGIFATIALA